MEAKIVKYTKNTKRFKDFILEEVSDKPLNLDSDQSWHANPNGHIKNYQSTGNDTNTTYH